MTAQIGFEDPQLQRMEQATLWLQRMGTAGQDERLVEDWLEWCQRDPQNQQAFDDMAAIWESSGQITREQPQAASRPLNTRRRALVASVAGLGLAAMLGAWWITRTDSAPALTHEYSSPIGLNTVHALADGSVLELGGGTRVSVSMDAKARRVELLEGELFVSVHHDAKRPFSVEAGRLEVIATGTAFNVLRTDERTTVTVTEGSVDALYEGQDAAAPNMRLQTSQQMVYTHALHSVVVRQADLQSAAAWRSGMLRFENEPLSEVIATINRYAASGIVIEDPEVRGMSFTGTAQTDRIAAWSQALPHIFPVVVQELADGRQLIGPRVAARSN